MSNYEDILQYPQIAIVMEEIKSNTNKGKFYIPSIMSTMGSNGLEDKSTASGSISTLNGKISRVKCKKTNYIELTVPDYIRKVDRCQGCTDVCEVEITCNHNISHTCTSTGKVTCKKKREILPIKKGTKFIVVFIGGDISNPKIIGVC